MEFIAETGMRKDEYDRLVSRFKKDRNSRYYRIIASSEIKDYIVKNRKRGLYNCNHCKLSFQTIYDLALHFDYYNVARSYYCNSPGCPYTVLGFASSNECNRHLNSVHGEKSHVCPDCTQAFSRVDQLNAHISRTHKNPHSRFNKKLYKQKSMNFIPNQYSMSSIPPTPPSSQGASLTVDYPSPDFSFDGQYQDYGYPESILGQPLPQIQPSFQYNQLPKLHGAKSTLGLSSQFHRHPQKRHSHKTTSKLQINYLIN